MERNQRCALAYVKERVNRLHRYRWDFGAVLPEDLQVNMHEQEKQWFNKYNKSLAAYMVSIGGLDITQNTVPPKALKVQVGLMITNYRCSRNCYMYARLLV